MAIMEGTIQRKLTISAKTFITIYTQGISNQLFEDSIKFCEFRANPIEGHTISPENPGSLKSSNYDGSKPTKFVIHGWKSSGGSSTVLNIKDGNLESNSIRLIC